MRLTARDVRLVRDTALSHVLSRDQAIRLGYFGSVTRANTRLRLLAREGYLRVLDTPFHSQRLYMAGRRAAEVAGERVAALLPGRRPSPQCLRHALFVTEVRIALAGRGYSAWRFEPQVRHAFSWGGKEVEARPDGLAVQGSRFLFVEADLGHVSHPRFLLKARSYAALLASGEFRSLFVASSFEVLVVTTGALRNRRLEALLPAGPPEIRIAVAEELGIAVPGGWS